jgi:hypothetical protein
MHVVAMLAIALAAISFAGAIAVGCFVWKAVPYPCEKCGVRSATHETEDERELCAPCYFAYMSDLRTAVSPQSKGAELVEIRPSLVAPNRFRPHSIRGRAIKTRSRPSASKS